MILRHVGSLLSLLFALTFILRANQAVGAAGSFNGIEHSQNASFLWGPYRPNLYFGVRPRLPKSLTTGLLWVKVDDFQSVQENFRHTCEQHEGMAGYGWDEYDVRKGGMQTVHDRGNLVDITTEFVKVPGGSHGGSWGVKIKGKPREDAPRGLKTTVIFYAGMEGLGTLEVERDESDDLGFAGAVTFNGETADLGNFKLQITPGSKKNTHPSKMHESYDDKPSDRTLVHSVQVPEVAIWQAKPVLFSQIKNVVDEYVAKYGAETAPPPWTAFTIAHKPGQGNLHFVQKVFEGAFEFDVLYSSGSAPTPMSSEDLSSEITGAKSAFSRRYNRIFPQVTPFDSPRHNVFFKSLFSNLLGGIGYFHGDAVVDRSYAPEYEEENEGFWLEAEQARARTKQQVEGPYELFTSVPSRPFFPRGFLWDEGFHLLPVVDWDVDLALEIVKSWFNLVDSDGWIAREQILGPEARSKVPAEFQVQYPHYANPPTLFFVLEAFIDRLRASTVAEPQDQQVLRDDVYSTHLEDTRLADKYLRDLYPLLKRHYFWFRKTQYGDIKSYDREASSNKEAYRWRGRTPRHILPSGIDDYPRAQPPHPGELHLDLISWMGMMTRSIRRIAETLGEDDDVSEFRGYEKAILQNIDDLHWSEEDQTFCDATIDDYEEHVHVCHKGYVSLFPFLTGLLEPDSPRLKPILELISNPDELWSNHGIRSLSRKDPFYGTDENYWRSPVWININYLVVRELLKLAQTDGPHKKQAAEIYSKLRVNLVDTVYKSWEKTGFAWEQYNPDTGEGQRTQHFTGWTSLIVKIMTMPDLGRERVRDEL